MIQTVRLEQAADVYVRMCEKVECAYDIRVDGYACLAASWSRDRGANGKGLMPGFKSSLSKDEIDALVKHVHQLAKTR